jgi:hypothetical protein
VGEFDCEFSESLGRDQPMGGLLGHIGLLALIRPLLHVVPDLLIHDIMGLSFASCCWQ